MLLQAILEGLGLGALLVLVCAIGIHKGAVGWRICMTRRYRNGALRWV